MTKKTYKIKGMHCASCAMLIEGELEDAGIKATCSYAKQTLEIESERDIDKHKVEAAVARAGYTTVD